MTTCEMTMEMQLRWAVNIVVVTVSPFYLGAAGQPLSAFLLYAVGVGAALTFSEQPSLFRALLSRSDVRSYLQVRIAMVLLGGVLPFIIGALVGSA